MTQTITMLEYNKMMNILWENIEYKRNGTIPACIFYINRRYNCTCGSIVKNIKEHLKTPKHERYLEQLREINNRCYYEAPPDSEDEQEEIKRHYDENEKYQEEKYKKYQEEKKQEEEKKEEKKQEDQEEQAIGPNQ